LEIGCGIGADGYEFARYGANYTGVDLTSSAVDLTRERFREAGVPGTFQVANAENLLFEDASFDHVYSFGVIHHSLNPGRIVAEAYRVLRPGGTITAMLYNRDSINYRVEIMGIRKVFRHLLRPRWAPDLFAKLTGIEREKLARHRKMYLEEGAVDDARWVSMNTDGPDCPLAQVYDAEEAAELFADFGDLDQRVRFFDWRHWPGIGPRLPAFVIRRLGHRWGWHRIVHGRKGG
ncbi:MAG: class I SAM-dependent methyltransferase, partial [Halobacteriales archaeon]|nr:class I SAM-dependent methyltransferase [Halobacteriales archaeon]